MRYIYTVLFVLLQPLIFIRLFWKGRKNAMYQARLAERFLGVAAAASPVDVWVHAVSMGEVVAAKGLIDSILASHQRVLVTTMTPTGSEQVVRLFGERVAHQYIPYDTPWALKRFFKAYQPRVGVIMETELWPNLMHEAKRMGVALFIANARISDPAFRAYQRVKWFFKPLFQCITAVFAQSEPDATRFIALGMPKDQVHVLGNMKSDLQVPKDVSHAVYGLKKAFGEQRPVVILASTHEGEEAAFLNVFAALKAMLPDVILMIAPRHPERFDGVHALAVSLGFKTARRSLPESIKTTTEVLVLDSMGELLGFYGLSDYAFVGGSLVPIGGHNVLEPMALHVPVFCGQYMQNSKSLCEALLEAKAMQQVLTAKALVEAIGALHANPEAKEAQVRRAAAVLKASQGALTRHVEAMSDYWQ